jgi:hypothetical protein
VGKADTEDIMSEAVANLKGARALSRNIWICLRSRKCKDFSRTDSELTLERARTPRDLLT